MCRRRAASVGGGARRVSDDGGVPPSGGGGRPSGGGDGGGQRRGGGVRRGPLLLRLHLRPLPAGPPRLQGTVIIPLRPATARFAPGSARSLASLVAARATNAPRRESQRGRGVWVYAAARCVFVTDQLIPR